MSIARRAAYDYISQILIQILSLASGIAISLSFGLAGAGVHLAVMLALNYGVNFTNLGSRLANQFHVAKNPESAGASHAATLIFVAISCGIAFGAVAAVPNVLLDKIFSDFNPAQRGMLWWAALALPFSLYNFGWSGIMIGLGRVPELAKFNFRFQLVHAAAVAFALGLYVAFGIGGLNLLLGAWAFVWVGGGIAMAWMLRGHPPILDGAARRFIDTFSYGIRVFIDNFAGNLMLQFNKGAIAAFGGPNALGIYGRADNYANKFFLHSQALETGGFQSMTATTREDAVRLACRLTRIALFAGLFIWAGGGMVGSVLIWLNGPEFTPGIAPLWVMMAAPLAMSGSRMLAMYYTGQRGRPQIPMTLAWIGAGINISLVYQGASRFGLMGAAAATSISFILHFALYASLFYREMRRFGFGLRDLLLPRREDLALFRAYAAKGWTRLMAGRAEQETP